MTPNPFEFLCVCNTPEGFSQWWQTRVWRRLEQFIELKPIKPQTLSPTVHVHSAHAKFAGTPLPQHLLLGGTSTYGHRDPTGNNFNDTQKASNCGQSGD